MPDKPPPSSELISVLRDQALDEIVRVATRAESYSRSIAEAAYRGDEVTVEVHLRQLRLCCLSMIGTWKDFLQGG